MNRGGSMDFNQYQKIALTTNTNNSRDTNDLMHRVLGLVGEAGEFAEKVKKVFRDNDGEFTEEHIAQITQEMGDVLWYLAVMADYFDVPLQDIADHNVTRLKDRKKRNQLHGSGDNR